MHEEPLGGADTAWYRMESPTNLMVVNAVLFFDDPLTYEELRDIVAMRVLRIPRFTHRIVTSKYSINRPQWEVDPTFSIDAHIHHVGLPTPGEAGLRTFLSDLCSQPLDHTKPLWQLYLIEGLDQGNALVARIHHSLADGFSLLFLMTKVADPGHTIHFPMGSVATIDPDTLAEEVAQVTQAANGSSRLPDLDKFTALSDPEVAADLARRARSASRVGGRLLMLPREARTSLRGDLGTIKRVDWTDPIPLARVKAIARSFDGTVNDVLLLALTSSLRDLLRQRGERLPEPMSLRCVMPVNLKPLEDRGEDLGNGFGLVFLDLPVGATDPHDRLNRLKRRLDDLKHSPEALITYAVLETVGLSPASVQARLTKLFWNKATAVTSNVPGPIEPITFAERDVSRILFWVPQSIGVGIGFSIFSYCGEVSVGLMADARLIPHTHHWVEAFHRAFEDLWTTVSEAAEEE